MPSRLAVADLGPRRSPDPAVAVHEVRPFDEAGGEWSGLVAFSSTAQGRETPEALARALTDLAGGDEHPRVARLAAMHQPIRRCAAGGLPLARADTPAAAPAGPSSVDEGARPAVSRAPAEKVLVMASEPVSAGSLRAALGEEAGELEVMVMAPALHRSMLRFWTSDADEAIAEAEDTQRETVEQLEREGIEARGDTAESTVPEAVEDALATFPAERVLLFSHPGEQKRYGEQVDPGELAARVGIPVERFTVRA